MGEDVPRQAGMVVRVDVGYPDAAEPPDHLIHPVADAALELAVGALPAVDQHAAAREPVEVDARHVAVL